MTTRADHTVGEVTRRAKQVVAHGPTAPGAHRPAKTTSPMGSPSFRRFDRCIAKTPSPNRPKRFYRKDLSRTSRTVGLPARTCPMGWVRIHHETAPVQRVHGSVFG